MNAAELVEQLLDYAEKHLHAEAEDRTFLRNRLMIAFKVSMPYTGARPKPLDSPDKLFDATVKYAEEVLKLNGDRFATEVMGIFTPMPSATARRFEKIEQEKDNSLACKDFYATCIASNYIRYSDLQRNIKWETRDENPLEITINLAKPEKTNKDIAQSAKVTSSGYPHCLLCAENVGFFGTDIHPCRANLRTIPLILDGEGWFMQYSPYLYFEEHCIVINNNHIPMAVTGRTPKKLLEFVERFPTYFMGSNASLPRVGGSILNHEHFQGGRHVMPLHRAGVRSVYRMPQFPAVEISIIDWLSTVVSVSGADKDDVADVVAHLIQNWNTFDAPEVDVLSHTGSVVHNAVAPIARCDGGVYVVDCILRNNRVNKKYPDGIFHVHPERQNIKQEGIGLIESMGLFILPARLLREMKEVTEIVMNPERLVPLAQKAHPLHIHYEMAKYLVERFGESEQSVIETAIRGYINATCREILVDTAVFKDTPEGANAFDRFLTSCGCV